jgi:hypothetical protein
MHVHPAGGDFKQILVSANGMVRYINSFRRTRSLSCNTILNSVQCRPACLGGHTLSTKHGSLKVVVVCRQLAYCLVMTMHTSRAQHKPGSLAAACRCCCMMSSCICLRWLPLDVLSSAEDASAEQRPAKKMTTGTQEGAPAALLSGYIAEAPKPIRLHPRQWCPAEKPPPTDVHARKCAAPACGVLFTGDPHKRHQPCTKGTAGSSRRLYRLQPTGRSPQA